MTKKEIICIRCPKGCHITVQSKNGDGITVIGNDCPRGIEYAKEEYSDPKRILPTTIRVTGGEMPLASVKTEKAIPKPLLLKAMAEIAEIEVAAPVRIGQVIRNDVMGTGVKLVATCHVAKK